MGIDGKDLAQMAQASCLDLDEDERNDCLQALNKILEYMDILKDLDTSQVEPTLHVNLEKNVFREDKAERSMDKEEALANAPEKDEGSFQVPRIV